MNDFTLTEEQIESLSFIVADLKIQSMMFDMAIDWETLQLEPKDTYRHPFWVLRYREKLDNSDYMPDGSDQQEYDNE